LTLLHFLAFLRDKKGNFKEEKKKNFLPVWVIRKQPDTNCSSFVGSFEVVDPSLDYLIGARRMISASSASLCVLLIIADDKALPFVMGYPSLHPSPLKSLGRATIL